MAARVAIAGGGLAGLTCAKSLVDAGYEVTVLERLPFLGGRASTFRDADGDWIEQGLHLFFGTYSEFQNLLKEIGQAPDDVLFWMNEVRYQDPEGPEAVYGINPLTAPLKTLLSGLTQNDYLGPLDKLSLAPVVAPALRSFEALARDHDDQTVQEWWAARGGTEEAMERFLRPFCRAIQFTDAEQFSAFNFLGWVHNVLYDLPHALAGGYRGARDDLIFAPLGRSLTDRGATIRTGVDLSEVLYDAESRRVTGFGLATGERVEADAYVAAVPAWVLGSLLPEPLKSDPFFAGIASLPVAPAIAVQLWFDRRVTDTADFTLVARTAVPVYQDQCDNAYPYGRGSRISATISPADGYLDWDDEALVKLTTEALGDVLPAVREAAVLKSVVLKHERHLVRPLPGAMSARPPQVTPTPNFFLAGDWTQQEYFGSQEGAVRSGRACAAEVVGKRVGGE